MIDILEQLVRGTAAITITVSKQVCMADGLDRHLGLSVLLYRTKPFDKNCNFEMMWLP